MEHLHHCLKSIDIDFPCLVEKLYDFNGEWLEYPEYCGIPLEKVRYHEWRKFSPEKLSHFLQNWLFFGLLRAVIPAEITIRMQDFIQVNSAGNNMITTRHLPGYLAKWTEAVKHLSQDKRDEIWRRNNLILDEARTLIYMLSGLPSGKSIKWYMWLPISLEIGLSCAFLGEALAATNARLLNTGIGKPWTKGELFLERMEIDGWCPSIVSGIASFSCLCTIHFCASLGGPSRELNHENCSEESCLRTADNEAQHSMQDCSCSMLKPNVEDLVEVIDRNLTPILRYTTKSHMEGLETAEAKDRTPYVAISHVWSDGLGNPAGNQINKCQAERIQTAIDQLYQKEPESHQSKDPGWWWLDTLCVPKGEPYKIQERLTIARMKQIYSNADKVLIIDSGLSTCSTLTPVLEILARFRLSNWIRRLWTIQEGLFASNLYLLVGETPISLSSLVAAARKLPIDGFENQIGKDLTAAYESIFAFSMTDNKNATAIVSSNLYPTEGSVWEVLQILSSRTSTFLGDEPVCLALLLNIDPTSIMEETRKEVKEAEEKKQHEEKMKLEKKREGYNGSGQSTTLDKAASSDRGPSKAGMVRFFSLAASLSSHLNPPGCIPPHIIAMQGKRLTHPGFRWAPETFLGLGEIRPPGHFSIPDPVYNHPPYSLLTRPSGVLTPKGLRVMFPGIIISEISAHSRQHLEYNFIIDTSADPNRQDYMPKFWKALYSRSEFEPPWSKVAPREEDAGKIALIVCEYGALNQTGLTGILVKIEDAEQARIGGDLDVERLCTMSGERTPHYDDQMWITEPWNRVKGTWRPVSQMWCVD